MIPNPGGRLLSFYKVCLENGCHPRVVHILQWGYKINLRNPIELSRHPTIHSGYTNRDKQKFLQDCVAQMLNVKEKSHCTSKNVQDSGILQQVVFSSKTREKMETGYRSEFAKQPSFSSYIQNGNGRGHSKRHLQRGMGSVHRFDRRLLPYSYTRKISTPPKISCGREIVPVPGLSIRHSYGSSRIFTSWERSKANAAKQGNSGSPVSRRLVTSCPIRRNVSSTFKATSRVCSRTWVGHQFLKIRTKAYSKFRFPGLQVRLGQRGGRTHRKEMADLDKSHRTVAKQLDHNPQSSHVFHRGPGITRKDSFNGQTTYEPFQWYLKTHWKYPQSLDMTIPCSEILKSHLSWWRDPSNVLIGSPLHAEEHNLLLFTDASVKGWGAHLENQTVSGLWSDTEKNLHINVLELKAVFLAIRSFQSHLVNKRVLVASDNATVVSYLNKQGRTHSLEMCLMIWRLMAFCNPRAILRRARHIQGCLNVIEDTLSCRDKIIQTEWSLHPKIFLMICQIWHRPMVDMFATKMNNKLPLAVDALNISWEALDGYAYCPIALIPKMIQKMRTYTCQMIVVASGWPGMSLFWDLIELSTKPPLLLPHWETLLKQPFSQRFHQNLQYLTLHVWHLDSRPQFLKNSQS